MCDTLIAAPPATADGVVLFAKNSDREPGEAQQIELHRGANRSDRPDLRCTWMSIPGVRRVFRTLICRPFWSWGAEMGANERGVVIGNQAVFTRFPAAESGLTGMDLLRIATRRAPDAGEALNIIIDHIERFGQGGRCGYRHANFRYHSSFVIADPTQAWVLETAGPFWAARRVRTVWSLSNALTIGSDYDRVSDEAEEYARQQGWTDDGEAFSFAGAFSNPLMDVLAGARRRRRCTLEHLASRMGELVAVDLMDALRSHGDETPHGGWRMGSPCAHASWQPTRSAGQTVGSMVSRLDSKRCVHWLTGTSAPCLSVFKPVVVGDEGDEAIDVGPAPGERFDPQSLFWRHERLHRKMLMRRFGDIDEFDAQRRLLQQRAFDIGNSDASVQELSQIWQQHRRQVLQWSEAVPAPRRLGGPFQMYWHYQNWRDGLSVG